MSDNTNDTVTRQPSLIEQGQCPECGEWSRVAQTGPYVVPVSADENGDPVIGLMHGPTWWTDEDGDPNAGPAGCPRCDSIVLVESECCFRTVEGAAR